jgi:hypothetical protein
MLATNLFLVLSACQSTTAPSPQGPDGSSGQAPEAPFDLKGHIDAMRKAHIPVRPGLDESGAPWNLVRATIPLNDKSPYEKARASASAQVAEFLSAEVSTWTESSYSEAGGEGPDGEGLALRGETLLMFNTDWK